MCGDTGKGKRVEDGAGKQGVIPLLGKTAVKPDGHVCVLGLSGQGMRSWPGEKK